MLCSLCGMDWDSRHSACPGCGLTHTELATGQITVGVNTLLLRWTCRPCAAREVSGETFSYAARVVGPEPICCPGCGGHAWLCELVHPLVPQAVLVTRAAVPGWPRRFVALASPTPDVERLEQ